MLDFMTRVFGSRNDRLVKGYSRLVREVNAFEAGLKPLSDDQLRAKTDEFRERLKAGSTLDAVLPEAFAVVREAARRTLKMRHFDVQLIGGMALHEGKIAECAPVRARRWSRPCPPTRMRSPATACTSSR